MSLLRPASVAALLLAASLSAQDGKGPECRHGPADDQGIVISGAHAAHPTRVAGVVDSVLEQGGYRVLRSPAGEGRWQIAPRFTWTAAEKEAADEGDAPPGVSLFVSSRVRGDSTRLEVGARVLCQLAEGGPKADELGAGRHLVARVDVQGEPRESHVWLFVFPGDEVKVRATFAPSDERRQAVEALVADALVKFAPRP